MYIWNETILLMWYNIDTWFQNPASPSQYRHGLSKSFRLFGSFLDEGGKRKLPREKCWSFTKNSLSALGHLYYVTSCFQSLMVVTRPYIYHWTKPIYILCFNIMFIIMFFVFVTYHFISKSFARSPENLWTPMVSILQNIIVCIFRQKTHHQIQTNPLPRAVTEMKIEMQWRMKVVQAGIF